MKKAFLLFLMLIIACFIIIGCKDSSGFRRKSHSYKVKSEFVERFLELSLFYGLSSPLNSEMICIFPYF